MHQHQEGWIACGVPHYRADLPAHDGAVLVAVVSDHLASQMTGAGRVRVMPDSTVMVVTSCHFSDFKNSQNFKFLL